MTNVRSDSFEPSRGFPAFGRAITIGELRFAEG